MVLTTKKPIKRYTTLRIRPEVVDELKKRKKYPYLTYSDLIKALLEGKG